MSSFTALDAHVPVPAPSAAFHSTTNPVDDFFGYSSRTHDSRHDRRISVAESSLAPPPYVEAPEYTKRDEPVTLAMFLFKFGFLFPPFWLMGIFILLSPLRAPPTATPSASWLPEKTDAERQVIIDRMRKAELKWARRCLYALVILVLVAVIISVSAWAILRS
ncbi:hypothetical protein R3P38DRAFT_2918991 [Favolaschia claudopus]|uniref:Transmembrane protein n=1 Tax=Favolaschia claudopus TaxID=2862362 RepID=A0AAW0C0W2_9AGAR